MVRKPRIWFPGAKYHIVSRGIRQSSLFHDEDDRYMYLSLLRGVKEKIPFNLHTYCLMTNHIHLQFATIDTPPGAIISQLHTQYAKYFNKRYNYSGHVFEGRYFANLISHPKYELEASRYIHLNPVEAKIVSQPEDYPWSSCRAYVLNAENPLLTTKDILTYFPHSPQHHYKEYLMTPNAKLILLNNGKVKIVSSTENDSIEQEEIQT